MADYPAQYRAGEIAGYNFTIAAGTVRTDMDSMRVRQRRQFRNLPHIYNVEVLIRRSELQGWLQWWMANAYVFFNFPLADGYSGELGANCIPHSARCITDVTISPTQSFEWLKAEFEMEIDPEWLDNNPAPVTAQNYVRP